MEILNLYAGIGGNRKLWKDVEVTAVENNPRIAMPKTATNNPTKTTFNIFFNIIFQIKSYGRAYFSPSNNLLNLSPARSVDFNIY